MMISYIALAMLLTPTAEAGQAAAPAQAETQAVTQPETTTTGVMNDPNERVCVRESVIGSRVATRRVCRTRAEWAAAQREVREEIERAQNQMTTTGQ